jgi:hypothetical protein
MKKNRMMRIAAFLLVAALLSICVVSGTYAKYTSEITGTDTARVAKWDFKVGGETAGVNNVFMFELFKTITDTDGSAETDINPTDGQIIAPGTQGNFVINLKNDSEVTAEYTVDFKETKTAAIPIQYSLDGTTWGTMDSIDVKTAVKVAIGGSASITVYWRWAFERGTTDSEKSANNALDTKLGMASEIKVAVTATITVEQVD